MAEFHIAKTVAEGRDLFLLGQMANRHGLIAGATGTGKTVTLRKMAEGFSAQGIPVFMSDVKGDLSGMPTRATGRARWASAWLNSGWTQKAT